MRFSVPPLTTVHIGYKDIGFSDLSYDKIDRIKRHSKQHVAYSDTVSMYPILCPIHIRNGMEARA